MTVEIKENWPTRADWATVGEIEVGAYAHGATVFACDSCYEHKAEVLLSSEELRDLGEACLALADRLDARAHIPAPPPEPIKLPQIHATRDPVRFTEEH